MGDVEQSVRHAAEQQTAERCLTTSADNDDVDAFILGCISDRMGGPTCASAKLLVRGTHASVAEVSHLPLHLFLNRSFVGLYRVAAAAANCDLFHVDGDNLRPVRLSELACLVHGAIGVIRAVAGPKDGFEHCSSFPPGRSDSLDPCVLSQTPQPKDVVRSYPLRATSAVVAKTSSTETGTSSVRLTIQPRSASATRAWIV